jgi:homoserine O-acetyltransferase/O-succinyltransferase
MGRLAGAKIFRDQKPLEIEYGPALLALEIAYETHGTLSALKDNAILLCPAFSAHSHVRSHAENPAPGWWEEMVGPGRAFDTNEHFVIGVSLLGSCYGTTGPLSIDPRTQKPYAEAFPAVTTRDMVNAHVRLLDHLGIERLYAAAGGSLGGMEVIELAVTHPERVARAIAVSGTDRTRPYTAAIRHIGRRAIMLDPRFMGGAYGDQPPVDGLRLARELGTLFYRSREEFNERFHHTPIRHPSRSGLTFDVQSYLDHQGKKVVEHFDVNSYLTLSLAMDLHDVGRGHASLADAYACVQASCLVVGVKEDRLIPIDEQAAVHAGLRAAGKSSTWRELSSPIGHDAFLVETEAATAMLREFFAKAV